MDRDEAQVDAQGSGTGLPRAGISRRAFVAASAAAAAAAGLVTGWATSSPAAQADAPTDLTYTIEDLKHIVVLMQENRSYDHYFGMIPGARGFGDKQIMELPTGNDVFHQPASRTDGGYLLPFRMNSETMNALSGWDLDHGWEGYHTMWNLGGWNNWVPAKTPLCMGYYTEDDLPFQHAVAHSWMVADHSHCSIMGPTHPNRLYQYSGQIGINGTTSDTVAAYDNDTRTEDWTCFAEHVMEAGVAAGLAPSDIYWAYQNNSDASYGGNYDCNASEWFVNVKNWSVSGTPTQVAMAAAAGVGQPDASSPPADYTTNMDWVLADFITACANNTLPLLATISPPGVWSEHPGEGDRGAHYVNRIIQALASNPDVWNSTLLIITYDEADGVFDHVPPPVPEPGEDREFLPMIDTHPAGHIGPGPRIPTMLVSPWTRGGKAYSGVLDHTSYQQFVEDWLARTQNITVTNPNITSWRRTLMHNLEAALDFKNPDFSVPQLPDTNAVLAQYDLDATLPAVSVPAVGEQQMPVPASEDGALVPVGSPYQQHATLAVDRTSGQVTATMTNDATPSGLSSGVCHLLLPDALLPFQATPYTVVPGTPRTHVWDASQTQGQYAFSIYGPDRFVRRFAGTVTEADQSVGGVPEVTAALQPGTTSTLQLSLHNDGFNPLEFLLTPNDYAGTQQRVFVEGGQTTTVAWPTDANGFYDVIVTDDSDTGFMHRYAGRISG